MIVGKLLSVTFLLGPGNFSGVNSLLKFRAVAVELQRNTLESYWLDSSEPGPCQVFNPRNNGKRKPMSKQITKLIH